MLRKQQELVLLRLINIKVMKKLLQLSIISILILSLSSCVVSSKPSIDFFNTAYYREQSNFTSINVPTFLAKSYVKSQLKNDGESEEVINLVKKVSKVRLMMSENVNPSIMTDFNNYMKDEQYEEWASIKNDGNLIKINAQQKEDIVKKLMIVVSSKEKDAVFVDVQGKFTVDDISKLINATEKSNVKVKFNKSKHYEN